MGNPEKLFPFKAEKCIFGGDAIARDEEGRVVMIRGLLPGETALCAITEEKKNFRRAEVRKRLTSSPERVEPECPLFSQCPGCAYQHCTPKLELEMKQLQFLDFIRSFDCEVLPPAEAEKHFHYRNKAVFHAHRAGGEMFLGYVKEDNQSVCDVPECLLLRSELNARLAGLRADKGFRHSLHDKMDLTLRYASGKDEVVFFRNRAPKNMTWLRENCSFGTLSVPADGFFQVNPEGMEQLLKLVGETLERENIVDFTDLYCGCGLFASLAASRGVKKIRAVELDENAAEAARYNLKAFPGVSSEVISGDAAAKFRLFANADRGGSGNSAVLVDPPRTGLGRGMAGLLRDFGCRLLFYVSCHPATWRRDALALTANGFRLENAGMVNMFPRTAHFELFTVFKREETSGNGKK